MILLWAVGQTINIMTIGGLALAVGVLVDEATLIIDRKRLEGYRFDRVWVRGDIHADVLQMLRMKERQ